jgi:hypothetical protein
VHEHSNDIRPTDARRPTTTEEATTTVATTVAPSAAPSAPTLISEAQLRVVVANAGGVNGLAARYTDRVSGLGYASVEPANATDRRDVSIVYWSPGREGEARRLAEQLGVAAVEPLPGDRIVLGNFVADVWAMIGFDLEER